MECIRRSIIRLLLILGFYTLYISSQEECKRGGCFPATGDLLVGREKQLLANSTCGLNGPSKYCILSFLDKTDKCFYCDSRRQVDERPDGYKNSHLPKYMVTREPSKRLQGWWQSVNGRQDVTIQLDLEAEFIFTHLIMTFKSFRPRAMYIERSSNYGNDWSDYRYFAYNCRKSFPNIPRGPQRKIDDVICEERYSKVEPSTGGEVVMKVLDPIIQKKEDPYSLKVLNLLKLTNLRVHFKELHTFGDDILGDSPKVNQKYYYALYEMVVRGSCSCYGHAEQCIPTKGTPANVNMVHGQCNCTHNTKGRNCEMCKDGYNDEPWRPAYQDQLNVCRKCNCNGHTDKCHFDPAVYKATGNTSGGVCDDCNHNTAGRQCELCKPLYYRDPYKNIFDEDVCKPCDCDPSGSFGGGECETISDPNNSSALTVAGRCICKPNAQGLRCDSCKDGYWNLLESNPDGCQSCNCDDKGTVELNKCDQQTGTCRCKRFVIGLTCSKCLEGFWNLGNTPEGCEPCNCDVGGSLNAKCDDITGMCMCKPNIIGRKCDQVAPGSYFGNLDQVISEAENSLVRSDSSSVEIVREILNPTDSRSFTGDGYLRVSDGTLVNFTNIRVPSTGFQTFVMRYSRPTPGSNNNVMVRITKTDGTILGGNGCVQTNEREIILNGVLNDDNFLELGDMFCLEKDTDYSVQLVVSNRNSPNDGGVNRGVTNLDSIVMMPNIDNLAIFQGREGMRLKSQYDLNNCRQYYLEPNGAANAPEICKKIQFSISAEINNGALKCNCDPTGTNSSGSSDILTCQKSGGQCPCKPGVVGRRCEKCAPGYFGFDSNGCTACACNDTGSEKLFCNGITGQCPCKNRIKGRQCNSCPSNHFGFPNCIACQCNEHSSTCDPISGECTNCKDNTAGPSCNLCAEGYYGDATAGTEKDCQRCQCPGGSSLNQFSNTCHLKPDGKVVCNNCTEGYTGDQCDKCEDGYYGNPLVPNGSCNKCDCNGNIDPFADGKCNAENGKCFNCINNSDGDHCENCKEGFFGNAKNQTCRACVCNKLGTNSAKSDSCDRETGQCECLPNVEGVECDRCKSGYYNIASGNGCVSCNCDKGGSLSSHCNQLDGQCNCLNGYGGLDCTQCEDFYFGDPKQNTCQACGCNPVGSITLQCNRTTGVCMCKDNVVGEKCDMCAPQTAGVMPQCEECHVCNDQWEDIVNDIEKNITTILTLKGSSPLNVSEIRAYTNDIADLKNRLDKIEEDFGKQMVDPNKINRLRDKVYRFSYNLTGINRDADFYMEMVNETITRDEKANDILDGLELRLATLQINTEDFKNNVTKIVESNIGGALNSTRESLEKSRKAQESVNDSDLKIKESKKMRKKIKKEIQNGDPEFEVMHNRSSEFVNNLADRENYLEGELEKLNRLLCGSDKRCGGCTKGGCDTCGVSGENYTCDDGIKMMSMMASDKALEAKEAIDQKLENASELLENVNRAKQHVIQANISANMAEDKAEEVNKIGQAVLKNITTLIKDIQDFLATDFNHPNASKDLAMQTIALNISLTPDEVVELGRKIRDAVKSLTGVDKILNESRNDYDTAIGLKEQALAAKERAIEVMNQTMAIIETLSQAEELQNSTLAGVNVARADIEDVKDLLKKLKEKLDAADNDLQMADNSTASAEDKRNAILDQNLENREKLDLSEKKIDEAEELGDKVQGSVDKMNEKYNATKAKLNEKEDMIEKVRARIKALADKTIKLYENADRKLRRINKMKDSYIINEERAKDLYYEIRRLEIKEFFINTKLEGTAKCYSTCNPIIPESFCRDVYKNIAVKETNAYAELEAEKASTTSLLI